MYVSCTLTGLFPVPLHRPSLLLVGNVTIDVVDGRNATVSCCMRLMQAEPCCTSRAANPPAIT